MKVRINDLIGGWMKGSEWTQVKRGPMIEPGLKVEGQGSKARRSGSCSISGVTGLGSEITGVGSG